MWYLFNYVDVQPFAAEHRASGCKASDASQFQQLHGEVADEDAAHVGQLECRETTSLLMRTAILPSNLHIQNLLELLEKSEKDLETQSEINSLNQTALFLQGTVLSNGISANDGYACLPLSTNVDTQAGLSQTTPSL